MCARSPVETGQPLLFSMRSVPRQNVSKTGTLWPRSRVHARPVRWPPWQGVAPRARWNPRLRLGRSGL